MTTNNLTTENTRLKTRVQMVEVELQRKDKVIDELLAQQEQNFGLPQAKFSSGPGRIKATETHLVINLKRKVKDLNNECGKRSEEIEALKRNIRSSRLQEVEVEVKIYMEECARLRH